MTFNPNPTPTPRNPGTADHCLTSTSCSYQSRDSLVQLQVTLGIIKDMVDKLQRQVDDMMNSAEDYGDCNDV
jgi:hypothetical protein